MVVGKRGSKDPRLGKKLPKRAGVRIQQAFQLVKDKSLSSLQKYGTGYRTAWGFRSCRAYMQRNGFKEPGSYDPNNLLNGKIFASPKEAKFLTGNKCSQIMWKAFQEKATKSQLQSISNMCSFGRQLLTGKPGDQWKAVQDCWIKLSPAEYGPPTRMLKATRYPQPRSAQKAFTTPWDRNTGWPIQRWSVAQFAAWDWVMNGAHCREDFLRIKKAVEHELNRLGGWQSTRLWGGRSKMEQRKGERVWRVYRTCTCPGGIHKGLPDTFARACRLFDLVTGEPLGQPGWHTECPLSAWELITHFLFMEGMEARCYPKWLPKSHKFGKEDHGRDVLLQEIKLWFAVQGANPTGEKWDNNGGRKALGALCSHHHIPYERSMDVHGDQAKNWVVYQPNVTRPREFKRREQHTDPRQCIQAHLMIINDWGRGPPKPEPIPPAVAITKEEVEGLKELLKSHPKPEPTPPPPMLTEEEVHGLKELLRKTPKPEPLPPPVMQMSDEMKDFHNLLKQAAKPKPEPAPQPVVMQMSEEMRNFQELMKVSVRMQPGGASELEKIYGKQ